MNELEKRAKLPTYLIVEEGADSWVNVSEGRQATVKWLTIARKYPDSPTNYSNLVDFSHTQYCKVMRRVSEKLIDCQLPEEMGERLANYLRKERIWGKVQIQLIKATQRCKNLDLKLFLARFADIALNLPGSREEYDCTDFTHELNNVPLKDHTWEFNRWEGKKWDGQEPLAQGVTLVMVREGKTEQGKETVTPTHSAISIGQGLFLSKFGTSKLAVTDVDNMILAFGGDTLFAITPRLS